MIAARLVIIAVAALTLAQTKPPLFDVVSVKPNRSGFRTPGVFRFEPDGSLRVVNMPLRDVTGVAHRLQSHQMDGWPGLAGRSD